jgi:hypothetical protein
MKYALWVYINRTWKRFAFTYRVYPSLTRLIFRRAGNCTAVEKIYD